MDVNRAKDFVEAEAVLCRKDGADPVYYFHNPALGVQRAGATAALPGRATIAVISHPDRSADRIFA